MRKKKLIEWLNLKYPEAGRISKKKVIVLVSGAIEAHGPHLPLGVDFFAPKVVAQEVCCRTGSIYGPEIPFGHSEALMSFPGTLTIRSETLADLIEDLISSYYRRGFRRFLVFNGHGDNPIGIRLAFSRLSTEKKDIVLKLVDWYNSDFVTVSKKQKYDVYHADKAETEMTMIYNESLVDLKKAKDYPNYKRKLPIGWKPDLKKYLPFAVGGEPSKANRKDAERLFENVVKEICKVVRKLEKR